MHQLKTFIFKILAFFPVKIGDFFYHSIQKLINRNKFNESVKSTHSTFLVLLKILEPLNISLQEKRILEIGTGWHTAFPYFMIFLGNAKEVITYDSNRHLSISNIIKLNNLFKTKFNVNIENDSESKFLDNRISYLPNTSIQDLDISKIDIVISRFVLEHVTPKDIFDIHHLFKEALPKDSYIIHFVSPSDHRAYFDKNLSLYDFLRYSESEWQKIQTRFDYHNRLRFSEYQAIFRDCGFEIVYQTFEAPDIQSKEYKKFTEIKLNKKFQSFEEKDLLASSLVFVLKV